MTAEEIKETVRQVVESAWYDKRSMNPVEEQITEFTHLAFRIYNQALEDARNEATKKELLSCVVTTVTLNEILDKLKK